MSTNTKYHLETKEQRNIGTSEMPLSCCNGVHPSENLLQVSSIPSVWCVGCGIGTVVNTFIQTVERSDIDFNKICVVSGIGCTGKVAEYLNFTSYTTTACDLFEFAANVKSKNTSSRVVVFSNNADLLVSGAADFINSAGRDDDLIVIHINNIVFTITEYGIVPASPFLRISVDQNFVLPFNIPHLAESYGVRYIARWTPLRAGWLMYSIMDTFAKRGFSLIEVVSPCSIYCSASDTIGDSVEQMEFYDRHSVIRQGECTENLDMRANNRIILGKFVDKR